MWSCFLLDNGGGWLAPKLHNQIWKRSLAQIFTKSPPQLWRRRAKKKPSKGCPELWRPTGHGIKLVVEMQHSQNRLVSRALSPPQPSRARTQYDRKYPLREHIDSTGLFEALIPPPRNAAVVSEDSLWRKNGYCTLQPHHGRFLVVVSPH